MLVRVIARAQPVDEQFAVRQARQVVVNGIVQQPLLGVAVLGHVEQRADAAQNLAVGAKHRPRPQVEPAIMTVLGAQPEILGDASPLQLDRRVEGRLEAIAVAGMEDLQPVARRPLQRAAAQAEQVLCLRPGEDAVAIDVPVPYDVAGADEGEGLPLGVADLPLHHHPASERVLHHGEADQENDQHEAAGKRRLNDVVDEVAGDRHQRRKRPHQQQNPRRDQHDRTVEAVGSQIDDDRKAEHGGEANGETGDARGHRWLDDRHPEKHGEPDQPADGEMAVADMPPVEVEVGVREDKQRCRQEHLRARAPRLVGTRRNVDDPVPEAEVDAYVDQTAQASAAVAGNMADPLTTKTMVMNNASSPEMPRTMPR